MKKNKRNWKLFKCKIINLILFHLKAGTKHSDVTLIVNEFLILAEASWSPPYPNSGFHNIFLCKRIIVIVIDISLKLFYCFTRRGLNEMTGIVTGERGHLKAKWSQM